MTHRGKEYTEDEKELGGEHNHKIYGCALQNSAQEARNPWKSGRCSPSPSENDRKGNKVYDERTCGRQCIRASVVKSDWRLEIEKTYRRQPRGW